MCGFAKVFGCLSASSLLRHLNIFGKGAFLKHATMLITAANSARRNPMQTSISAVKSLMTALLPLSREILHPSLIVKHNKPAKKQRIAIRRILAGESLGFFLLQSITDSSDRPENAIENQGDIICRGLQEVRALRGYSSEMSRRARSMLFFGFLRHPAR